MKLLLHFLLIGGHALTLLITVEKKLVAHALSFNCFSPSLALIGTPLCLSIHFDVL